MTSPSQPPATWAAGDRYEPYVGRWSRRVAPEFLAWFAIPAGKRWLDMGCGTGALSQTIIASAQPSAVAGVDPSEGFLAFARARLRQHLHDTLPIEGDGSIRLIARAFAVRGRKPA